MARKGPDPIAFWGAYLLVKGEQRRMQKKLERLHEQVRKHKPAVYRNVNCPSCQTLNEGGQWVCYMCGWSLA